MEDVVAGQLLTIARHVLATNNADVIRSELLFCRVRIQVVHVADGTTRQNDVTQRFFECSTTIYEKCAITFFYLVL